MTTSSSSSRIPSSVFNLGWFPDCNTNILDDHSPEVVLSFQVVLSHAGRFSNTTCTQYICRNSRGALQGQLSPEGHHFDFRVQDEPGGPPETQHLHVELRLLKEVGRLKSLVMLSTLKVNLMRDCHLVVKGDVLSSRGLLRLSRSDVPEVRDDVKCVLDIILSHSRSKMDLFFTPDNDDDDDNNTRNDEGNSIISKKEICKWLVQVVDNGGLLEEAVKESHSICITSLQGDGHVRVEFQPQNTSDIEIILLQDHEDTPRRVRRGSRTCRHAIDLGKERPVRMIFNLDDNDEESNSLDESCWTEVVAPLSRLIQIRPSLREDNGKRVLDKSSFQWIRTNSSKDFCTFTLRIAFNNSSKFQSVLNVIYPTGHMSVRQCLLVNETMSLFSTSSLKMRFLPPTRVKHGPELMLKVSSEPRKADCKFDSEWRNSFVMGNFCVEAISMSGSKNKSVMCQTTGSQPFKVWSQDELEVLKEFQEYRLKSMPVAAKTEMLWFELSRKFQLQQNAIDKPSFNPYSFNDVMACLNTDDGLLNYGQKCFNEGQSHQKLFLCQTPRVSYEQLTSSHKAIMLAEESEQMLETLSSIEANRNSSWTIETPKGHQLLIEFKHLDLEAGAFGLRKGDFCLFDSLTIEDLDNQKVIRKLCGSWQVQDLTDLQVRSIGNRIKISFITDYTITSKGFKVKVSSVPHLSSTSVADLARPEKPPPVLLSETNGSLHVDLANDLDVVYRINNGLGHTRISLIVQTEDLEWSPGCIFDNVSISEHDDRTLVTCGQERSKEVSFVSDGHEVWIRIQTDFAVASGHLSFSWTSFRPVRHCLNQTLTSSKADFQVPLLVQETNSSTPSLPVVYVAPLTCVYTIVAPLDHRVVLGLQGLRLPTMRTRRRYTQNCSEFPIHLRVSVSARAQLFICNDTDRTTQSQVISDGNWLEITFTVQEPFVPVNLHDSYPMKLAFKTESVQLEHVAKPIVLPTNGDNDVVLRNVNYPLATPKELIFSRPLTTTSGYNIRLSLPVHKWNQKCPGSYLEIEDPYKMPRKTWRLCHFASLDDQPRLGHSPVFIQSFLSILILREVTSLASGHVGGGLRFAIRASAVPDHDTLVKVVHLTKANITSPAYHPNTSAHDNQVCDDNLCFNGGKCDQESNKCLCVGHFTGRHCLQTACDSQPCLNGGTCHLTPSGFRCTCPSGLKGQLCETQLHPCEQKPCSRHGNCIEEGDSFRCQCHLWWTGPKCDLPMTDIPFKPLSERMMEEPFWLGLMTVFLVLILLAVCYLMKKHLPKKIERFLVDEMEKGRLVQRGYNGYYQYTPQVSVASDCGIGAIANDFPSTSDYNRSGSLDLLSPSVVARSFLSRLSGRKSSLLSLSSNASSPGCFERKYSTSQEEIYPRGSPSPMKRQFLSPKDEEERRKILKMLVTPNPNTQGNKNKLRHDSTASFDHMIIKAARSAENIPAESEMTRKQSSFSLQIPGMPTSPNSMLANKKVTFSQVVDQMACSLSDSSSLSDLSYVADDFKLNVSSGAAAAASQQLGHRRARKLFRTGRLNKRRKMGGSGSFSYSGNSGSEDVYESSIESLESSSNNSSFRMRSQSTLSPHTSKQQNPKQLHKISSADSLLSMIRNLKANSNASAPSSPQLSEIGDTPPLLNTPDTPGISVFSSPLRKDSSAKIGTQIKVEVHEYPDEESDSSTGKGGSPVGSTSSLVPVGGAGGGGTSAGGSNPNLTLEVPGFHYGKCLSPIKELPSPIPTPQHSPLPHRSSPTGSQESSSSSNTSSNTSSPSTSSRRSSFRNMFKKRKSSPVMTSKELEKSVMTALDNHHNDRDNNNDSEHQNLPPILMRRYSYAGDGSALFQETSFVVPQPRASGSRRNSISSGPSRKLTQTKIPIITLTVHEATDEDDDLENNENADIQEMSTNPNVPQVMITSPESSIDRADPPEEPFTVHEAPTPRKPSPRCRPPNIYIPNSNFNAFKQNEVSTTEGTELELKEITSPKQPIQDIIGSPGSPKRLVKQKEVHEGDIETAETSFTNAPSSSASPGLGNESPKFLSIPESFDSTPRSRSQSVELPEFRVIQIPENDRSHSPPQIFIGRVDLSGNNGEVFGSKLRLGERRGSARAADERLSTLNEQRKACQSRHQQHRHHHNHHHHNHNHNHPPSSDKPENSWKGIRMGSPPPAKRRGSSSSSSSHADRLRSYDKPQSLDLPFMAPAITVTPMSDADSADSTESLATLRQKHLLHNHHHHFQRQSSHGGSSLGPPVSSSASSNMHYLSPMTIMTTNCGSRTTSESNLSSSGYSSMASPGPSRSGSSNPLFISESEDTSSTPTAVNAGFFSVGNAIGTSGIASQAIFIRRPNALLKSPSVDSESSEPTPPHYPQHSSGNHFSSPRRGICLRKLHENIAFISRTDSETTDEQCIPESISEEVNDSLLDEDSIGDEDVSGEDSVETTMTVTAKENQANETITIETRLESRESSTESDKTVLSINVAKDSLPETPNTCIGYLGIPVPEIVVDECPKLYSTPCSSLMSLNATDDSQGTSSNVSLLEESSLASSVRTSSSGHSKSSIVPKASSVPPLSNSPNSCLHDYDTLLSHEVSTSSSRSESPMSELLYGKCTKELMALHHEELRLIESDIPHNDEHKAESKARPRRMRRRKRKFKSLKPVASNDQVFVEASSVTPQSSGISARRRLRHQEGFSKPKTSSLSSVPTTILNSDSTSSDESILSTKSASVRSNSKMPRRKPRASKLFQTQTPKPIVFESTKSDSSFKFSSSFDCLLPMEIEKGTTGLNSCSSSSSSASKTGSPVMSVGFRLMSSSSGKGTE